RARPGRLVRVERQRRLAERPLRDPPRPEPELRGQARKPGERRVRVRRRRLRGLRHTRRVLTAVLADPSERGGQAPPPFLLPALFFASGALGLVYEVLWMRWFTTLFGATTLATTATLSGFFLGLAAGSHTFGARSKRWQRPVRAFGLLEIGVGVGALLVPLVLDLYRQAYPYLYPRLAPYPAGFAVVKLLLAVGAIGIPTF